jgi:hypothetical protein
MVKKGSEPLDVQKHHADVPDLTAKLHLLAQQPVHHGR